MSLADEVLATHVAKPWPNAKDWCAGCGSKVDWPCESVRLALSLQAAENVVEAARQARIFIQTIQPEYRELESALAEYDKGGQG